ncbi:hypothetical protein FC093_07780 [Ilyomonas limi]|uniref:Cytochrome c domain-containing protein n=1 Tax=Ilyomonas limi TaxID=2575867 RepID=A0A4U3L6F6_9BACT|nr:FN3 associated domain-containing protein [Ilyomonas limi]TKK69207.1 hypothetical protein FC093_07780 [Ilyomonas limi]
MKFKNIAAASLIPLNTLLLFLLIAGDRVVVPAWLQVFGRMHPLFLHFPIVLILLYVVFVLAVPKVYKVEKWYTTLAEVFLLSAAFTASLTALMGLFLSREPGYDVDALQLHKYTGVLTALVLFIMYQLHDWLQRYSNVLKVGVGIAALVVIYTGHLGADITHGDNFVTAPIIHQEVKQRAALEDAFVYADLVEPILQDKCMGCHNSNKSKGELAMDTKDLLLKGGKDGKLWDTTKPDMGLLMTRIHLPEEEKEHMPPAGKPQLTENEMTILYAWIKSGAEFDKKVTDLSPTDTLRILAGKVLKSSADEQYAFAPADEKEISKLNNNNRVITPLAIGSPALAVNFFNKPFYNKKALEELAPVKDKIVELNLDNMPVKDEDLKVISGFSNLRKLNLNFSDVTGSTLSELGKLQFLRSISLSGTAVKASQLTALANLPKLRAVYLWNTTAASGDVQLLESKNKNIVYQTGFTGDTVVLKLNPPVVENEEQVISKAEPLRLKHYVNGTTIRYTLDGTEPDSIHSPVYNSNVMLDNNVTVKAKAYKKGWISSDIIEQHFYKSSYEPDSAVLLTQPDKSRAASGAKTLIDLQKGSLNFGDGKWLGYRDKPVLATFYFPQTITAKNISFSMLENVDAYIFPPQQITVWASTDGKQWKTLGNITPKQPEQKDKDANRLISAECTFPPTALQYIKFEAKPVEALPAWHRGKGDKGWVFMDEVFVN